MIITELRKIEESVTCNDSNKLIKITSLPNNEKSVYPKIN